MSESYWAFGSPRHRLSICLCPTPGGKLLLDRFGYLRLHSVCMVKARLAIGDFRRKVVWMLVSFNITKVGPEHPDGNTAKGVFFVSRPTFTFGKINKVNKMATPTPSNYSGLPHWYASCLRTIIVVILVTQHTLAQSVVSIDDTFLRGRDVQNSMRIYTDSTEKQTIQTIQAKKDFFKPFSSKYPTNKFPHWILFSISNRLLTYQELILKYEQIFADTIYVYDMTHTNSDLMCRTFIL